MQLIAKDPEEDDEDVGANLDQRGEAMRDAVLVEDVMEMGAIGTERRTAMTDAEGHDAKGIPYGYGQEGKRHGNERELVIAVLEPLEGGV